MQKYVTHLLSLFKYEIKCEWEIKKKYLLLWGREWKGEAWKWALLANIHKYKV